MYTIKGKIQFDPINLTTKHENQSSWKKNVVVVFDCDLYAYYAWFIRKRFGLFLNKPIRGTHFSLINDRVDDEIYEQARAIFDGKEITLEYDPGLIRSNDKGHWWLKVNSQDADNIRAAMGLGKPFFGFHITIGQATAHRLVLSRYATETCIKFDK